MSNKVVKIDKETIPRSNYYACLVYEDSAPNNWQLILADLHVPCFISPYHDSDINADGTPKKPHWHVMFLFDSLKTRKQAETLFKMINGVGVEFILSKRGYARYLCHLDNPEKFQYPVEHVQAFSGADYFSIIDVVTDRYQAISEMQEFIDKNHVISYAQFSRYCRKFKFPWFRCLCDNGTFVISEYIRSRAWEIKEGLPTEIPDSWIFQDFEKIAEL